MEEVEQRLEIWQEAMEVRGMRVSRQKTEYLKLRAGDRQDVGTVAMQGEVVKQVEGFKYLGSTQRDCKTNTGGLGSMEKNNRGDV